MAQRAATKKKATTPHSGQVPETGSREPDEIRALRKAALDRLWKIGWDADLDAIRLGDGDHSPK